MKDINQMKLVAEMTKNVTEERLNNQITNTIERLEETLRMVKKIQVEPKTLDEKAEAILREITYSIKNLELDRLMNESGSYRAVTTRLKVITELKEG
jgi:hypothetical protein